MGIDLFSEAEEINRHIQQIYDEARLVESWPALRKKTQAGFRTSRMN
ncbi:MULTISPECIES: hypothetical protein [Pseudomonas]